MFDVGKGDGWVGGGEGAVIAIYSPEASADGYDAAIIAISLAFVRDE